MDPESVAKFLDKTFLASLFLKCPVTNTAVQIAVVLDIKCPLLVGRAEGRVLPGRTRSTKKFQKNDARMRSKVQSGRATPLNVK